MSEHTLPTLCNLALCAYHVPGYNLQPRTPRETNGALPSNRCSMGALQDDAASTGCVSPTGTQSKQDTDSWHLKPIPAHTTLHGQMHRSLSPDWHLMTRHPINQPASKFSIPRSPFLTCASSNISLPETSYLPTQNTLCQMDHTHRPAPPQQLTSNQLHCTHSAT